MLKRRGNALSFGIGMAALFLFVLGLLPDSVLSSWVLSMSYSRKEIAEISYVIILVRLFCIALGVLIALHTIPSIRNLWTSRILISPPPEQISTYRPGSSDRSIWFLTTVCLGLLSVPIFMALVAHPNWMRPLLNEDRGYEAATAYAYIIAAVLVAIALCSTIRNPHRIVAVQFLWLGLSILLLWVGLEEMSYGQRVFHFHTPEAIAAINQQNEFNLHNVATGLVNRLFTVGVICFGVFFPIATWVWPRMEYLLKRLGILLPQSASVLTFAYASVFTTPRKFVMSAFDEQRFLYYLVVAAFVGFLLYSLAHREQRRTLFPLLVFIALIVGSKLFLNAYEHKFPVPNHPEEFKECLFGLGFLLYSWNMVKWSRLPWQKAEKHS